MLLKALVPISRHRKLQLKAHVMRHTSENHLQCCCGSVEDAAVHLT